MMTSTDLTDAERMRTLLLRPKPWWVPYWAWAWLLRRILTIEIKRLS